MVKQTIQIFARIKPSKQQRIGHYKVSSDEDGHPCLQLLVPKELASGFINNKRDKFLFRFNQIFDQKTSQDEVFKNVAKPVIDNALLGFNGTIFAYGQTGSGKTFTVTGGPEKYSDRGIIPRTLSYIFETLSKVSKNADRMFNIHISYLEIYNESGYDLLDPKHEVSRLEDLPKVTLMEDSDQNIHLKNLCVHHAQSEEAALNLLFMGDTNRMIAETPMNQASSRSHCIFTIHISSQQEGSAIVRKAKLHLVDLAGSERVSKTGINGVILTEAKYINLSLHYLEQVIVALADKNRQHVPYRNSMMTSVLRDSLGGNCMTTMIATCSMERSNIDESISTCRFAQRVALIKNDVTQNEELDPRLLIDKLKSENAELREQLALVSGENLLQELSQEHIDRCEQRVKIFLEDQDPDSYLDVGHDLRQVRQCFGILKRLCLERSAHNKINKPNEDQTWEDISPYKNFEAEKLKHLLEQRDNEINILVNMLKRERNRYTGAAKDEESLQTSTSDVNFDPIDVSLSGTDNKTQAPDDNKDINYGALSRQATFHINRSSSSSAPIQNQDTLKAKILGEMSLGRQEAFDVFMQDYPDKEQIETNKRTLRQMYLQAKALGDQLQACKTHMNHLKNLLTQERDQENSLGLETWSQSEGDIKRQMEEKKMEYKNTFLKLRAMKTEIEHVQHSLERLKVRLMRDFEVWWAEQVARRHEQRRKNRLSDTNQSDGVWPPLSPDLQGRSCQSYASRDSLFLTSQNLPSLNSSGHISRPSSQPLLAGLPLTGDSKVDADIQAFVKARQSVLMRAQAQQR